MGGGGGAEGSIMQGKILWKAVESFCVRVVGGGMLENGIGWK